MSLTYSTFQTQIQDLVPSMSTAQFTTTSPGMIDYAEQRCYRDLDLLSTVVTDTSVSFSPGSNTLTFGQFFVVVDTINILSGTTRVATLTPASRAVIYNLWPSVPAGPPQWFAPITDQTIVVGPFPDSAYVAEVIGKVRPAPLTSTNTTTFLTTNLPDLFIAAAMVYMSGWMRNFGSQADDAQMAQSWEGQYEKLLASANAEEMRRKFAGAGWSSRNPAPMTQAPG